MNEKQMQLVRESIKRKNYEKEVKSNMGAKTQSKHAKAVDKGLKAKIKAKRGSPLNRSDKDRRKRI